MNYLEEAINKLHQGFYYTPVSVINKIKKEKILSIIGNPKFKIKKMKNKYDILSPDGFSIDAFKYYKTKNEAEEAFINWKKRYELQGYYSSNKGKIYLSELRENCKLVKL
jgi:hypothetical protein